MNERMHIVVFHGVTVLTLSSCVPLLVKQRMYFPLALFAGIGLFLSKSTMKCLELKK